MLACVFGCGAHSSTLGFRVKGFRVWGLGFRGLGFRVIYWILRIDRIVWQCVRASMRKAVKFVLLTMPLHWTKLVLAWLTREMTTAQILLRGPKL